jgi:carboxymethylenebutenolidase
MSAVSGQVISTPDGPMPAFEAAPGGPAQGGVLVLQEAFGLTGHIRSICGRLADAGWHAIAPALFHRQDRLAFDYSDIEGARKQMQEFTAEGITADLEAALDYLGGIGFSGRAAGVVGFCMGGGLALYAGSLRPLGAAVTFYGGGVSSGRFGLPALTELAPLLRSPWLGLYGDLDHTIPVEEAEDLRAAAATAAVPTELVRYAEAGHGFNCDARASAFNPAAAADAWHRATAWFASHVGSEAGLPSA